MTKDEKIKIAITAGIAAVILLILVVFLALSGKTSSDEAKLDENISDYVNSNMASAETSISQASASLSAVTGSSDNTSADASADDADKDASAQASSEASTESSDQNTVVNSSTISKSFFVTKPAEMKNNYKGMKYDVNAQLKEMFAYWSDGNMEAVRDLAHLDRFEVMSYSLQGTTDFYYYGDKGGDGLPNGTGVAVYANDQYYYGEWVSGQRSGKGTWISFYPSYSKYVVKEHMYSGEWQSDLPNGEGQEHYDYDHSLMTKTDTYLQNAIGGFKDGYYNGDMYIITETCDKDTEEWVGKCNAGNWEQVLYAAVDKFGRIPVLNQRENSEQHIYMSEEGAKKNGIIGIITGGNIRK